MPCGIKLKRLLLLSVLLSPCFSLSCFSDVILTEEEAAKIQEALYSSMTELEKARSETQELKVLLSEQEKALTEQESGLEKLESSYQKELKEVKKEKKTAWALTGASSTVSALLAVLLLIVLL